jgi:hypothetical protein
MKILLFDWTPGGHHALYLRRLAEALCGEATVVVAAPESARRSLADLPAAFLSLGEPRPSVDLSKPLSPQHRALAEQELDLLVRVVADVGADHVLHPYGDPIIRRLVDRPLLAAPLSLVLFFPRRHYPSLLQTRLDPKERLRAAFLEHLVRRWRRRPDAHAILALDELAAARWAQGAGAPAHWLPEPPVGLLPPPAVERSGCALFGMLAPRKGIDLLAEAVSCAPTDLRVTLAGAVERGAEVLVRDAVRRMERAGANVDLRDRWHDEAEGLSVLAAARCAVLPYPRHYGMSRVLLEAAAVATPVVVHDFGLVAHLVRTYGLGQVVDCRDASALRYALLELADDGDAPSRYAPALAAFTARYSPERFRGAVLGLFDLETAACAA